MNTVYARVNISKKLKAVLKPGTPFLVETDDVGSGIGRISFEVRDGIDPSVVAALGDSSVSIAAINRSAPPPRIVEEANYPEPVYAETATPPLAPIEERLPPATEDFVESMNLVGGAKPVSNFSAKKVVKKDASLAVPKRTAVQTPVPVPAPVSSPAPAPAPKSRVIESADAFYQFLDGVDSDPTALAKSENRMSRGEAVKAEIKGALGSGVSMHIVNVCGAQLVIDDLGIRLLRGDGYNLGSIPAAKLKASTHLFEALNAGQIKFVKRETADGARLKAVKRQEQITRGDAPDGVYDKADDIYDEIEVGSVDDAAVNAVPSHLRNADSIDISGDDEYETELDLIRSHVEQRETEIETDSPPVENIPGRRVVERETR